MSRDWLDRRRLRADIAPSRQKGTPYRDRQALFRHESCICMGDEKKKETFGSPNMCLENGRRRKLPYLSLRRKGLARRVITIINARRPR